MQIHVHEILSVDTDQDAIEAFQKALIQAQNNPESKQDRTVTMETDSDSQATFIGNVSSDSTSDAQSNSLSDAENRTLPSWALFLMGLLVLPIFTGIISFNLLMDAEDSGLTYEAYNPTSKPSITIQNETYYVHEFNLGYGFNQHYPPDCESDCWEMIVVVNNRIDGTNGVIWGNRDGPSYNRFEKFAENGNVWHSMYVVNCDEMVQEGMDCDDDILINIKTDESTINVATEYSEAPIYFEYWADDMASERGQYLFFFGLIIWPISIIGGIIWGFKTNRKPFAYGILSAGLLVVGGPFFGVIYLLEFIFYNLNF